MTKIYLLGLATIPVLWLTRELFIFVSYAGAYGMGYTIYRLLCLWANREKVMAKFEQGRGLFIWALYKSIAWRWPMTGCTHMSATSIQSADWIWYPPMGFRYAGKQNLKRSVR